MNARGATVILLPVCIGLASLPAGAEEPLPELVPVAEAAPEAERAEPASTTFSTTILGARPDPTGTVDRLDADALADRGATSVADALRLIPGVQISEGPKRGSGLAMRGFDERSVAILYDGIPVSEVYAGGYDLSALAATGLHSLVVERGVTSVLYGPGTSGGVVRLVPLAPEDQLHGRAEVRLGGLHDRWELPDRGGQLAASRKIGPFGLAAGLSYWDSAQFALSDDYRVIPENQPFHEDGGSRAGSDRRLGLALGQLSFDRGPLDLALLGSFTTQERGIPPFEGSGYTRYWRYRDYDTTLVGLKGRYRFGGQDAWLRLRPAEAQAYLSLHADTIDDYQDASYQEPTTNPLAFFRSSAYDNATHGARLGTSVGLGPHDELALVLGVRRDRSEQRDLPVPRPGLPTPAWGAADVYAATLVHAAAENTWLHGPFRVVGGAGLLGVGFTAEEHGGRTYPVSGRTVRGWQARLLGEWAVTEPLRLMVAVGRKERPPTLRELYSNALGGNPGLRPELAWQSEAGLDLTGWPWRGLRLRLRGFYDQVQDRIERPIAAWINVGQSTLAGGELGLQLQPTSRVELSLAYTYLFTRNEQTGHALDYQAPHAGSAELKLSGPWGLALTTFALAQGEERDWYFSNLENRTVEERLPGFLVVGGRLRRDLELGRGRTYLFVEGSNLSDSNSVVGSFSPQPGRRLYAGVGGEL